jgi:hypothetical protein
MLRHLVKDVRLKGGDGRRYYYFGYRQNSRHGYRLGLHDRRRRNLFIDNYQRLDRLRCRQAGSNHRHWRG